MKNNTIRIQRSLIPEPPKGMKQGIFLVFVHGKDEKTLRAKTSVLKKMVRGLRKDHPVWLAEAL